MFSKGDGGAPGKSIEMKVNTGFSDSSPGIHVLILY